MAALSAWAQKWIARMLFQHKQDQDGSASSAASWIAALSALGCEGRGAQAVYDGSRMHRRYRASYLATIALRARRLPTCLRASSACCASHAASLRLLAYAAQRAGSIRMRMRRSLKRTTHRRVDAAGPAAAEGPSVQPVWTSHAAASHAPTHPFCLCFRPS